MEYIIDAYNLIKSSFLAQYEQDSQMDHAREALLGVLLGYKRKHPSVSFTVVFDGFPPTPGIFLKDRRIRMLFSGDITADEMIRKILEKNPGANRTKTVVSNDRGVQDCGRLFSCGVMGVDAFLDRVSPPPKKAGRQDGRRKEDMGEKAKRSIEQELKNYYGK